MRHQMFQSSIIAMTTTMIVSCGETEIKNFRTPFVEEVGERTEEIAQPVESADATAKTGMSQLDAFKLTTYPLVRERCSGCHAATIAPFFAHETPDEALKAITDTDKVDFQSVSTSRLVQRLLTDRHNCWSECDADSKTMLDSINQWVSLMQTDSATQAFATLTATFAQAENRDIKVPIDTVIIEGETATLKAPMTRRTNAAASGASFVGTTNNNANAFAVNSNAAGTATYSFQVEKAGTYKVFGRTLAASTGDDTFFVKMDGGTATSWKIPVTAANTFQWNVATNNNSDLSFMLSEGMHTLEIREQEDGAALDTVAVTTNVTFDGTAQKTTESVKVLRFSLESLTNLTDAFVEIEIADFDTASYKVRRPAIITASKSIKIKGLKLLVNGKGDRGTATFGLIDQTIPPPGNTLIQAASIVAKDKGAQQDEFSIEFDEIKVQ